MALACKEPSEPGQSNSTKQPGETQGAHKGTCKRALASVMGQAARPVTTGTAKQPPSLRPWLHQQERETPWQLQQVSGMRQSPWTHS